MSDSDLLFLGLLFIGALVYLFFKLRPQPGSCGCGEGDCPSKPKEKHE